MSTCEDCLKYREKHNPSEGFCSLHGTYVDPRDGCRDLVARAKPGPPRLTARITQLETALRPFAKMDRDGGDLDEIACVRGVASDMTAITSADFRAAKEALDATR